MPDLKGTPVLISGATSGLGLAMARALTAAGARVAVTSRRRERAEAVARELGDGAVGLELDVGDQTSVEAAVGEAYERLGTVEVLVNNAGLGMRTVNPHFMTQPQPMWEVSPEGFDRVIDSKLRGGFLLSRAVVPRMLSAGRGRVVTISMNEQTMVRRGFVPYGPAGAAVEAMGRVLAEDLVDTPVRANLLLPGGATNTGMIPEDFPSPGREALLDPAVMGPAIVWLASAHASEVHGERIVARDFERWLAARHGDGGRAGSA